MTDDELDALRAQLRQRGLDERTAEALVDHRDHCDACRTMMKEML